MFTFGAAAFWADIVDNTVIATQRIAVNRVIDRTVPDTVVMHAADNGFKGRKVFGRVAIHFHIAYMAGIGKLVIRPFQLNLLGSFDRLINRYMEGICIIIFIRYAGDFSVQLLINFKKPAAEPFGGGCQQGEI